MQLDNYTEIAVGPSRIESSIPTLYRLAKTSDGTLILQGGYRWQQGFTNTGITWRDIETVPYESSN